MKCPFRKRTIYVSGRNTGCSYPMEWTSSDEFEDCIQKDCMAFYEKEVYSNYERKYVTVGRCGLCRKKHEQTFSDEFMLKLP